MAAGAASTPPGPYPLAGPACSLALLAGTCSAFALAELPPMWGAWTGALPALLLWLLPWRGRPSLRAAGAAGFGFCLALIASGHALQQRLPAAHAGQDLRVEGRVEGLPERSPEAIRFDFRVEAGEGEAAALEGRLLRLAWYRGTQQPEAGSRWRLVVRLKPPRGVLNPGGFDFERHALMRRLAATGYVRESAENAALAPPAGLDALRAGLAQRMLEGLGGEGPAHAESRFVRALAVADTRGLSGPDWEVLRATGVSHLISISGLHVGMVAGLFALLARLLYRAVPALGLHLPLPQGAALLALLAAIGYAALAGFGLPTVRSVLMIAAALLAVLLRRVSSAWQAYALALLVLLLSDPLAVLGAGFWLSFAGVAWLLWCLPSQAAAVPGWRQLVSAQLVASLGLLPLTVFFFGQASLAGAVANLIAVPWVSLAVVPLSLVAAGLYLLGLDALAHVPLWLGARCMDGLWWLLEAVAAWPRAQIFLPEPSLPMLLPALAGLLWLLLPRGVPGRALGLCLLAPLLWPRQAPPDPGALRVQVMDVGQGLAVLVQTHAHALLFDSGPAFGSGLDMGEAAVVPSLRALGVQRLDRIVVSHGDADHAGGARSVLAAFPAPLSSSDLGQFARAEPCVAGRRWQWDGVQFELLHPPPHFPYQRNESSCVLRVGSAHGSLLLSGDIGHLIEARLLRERAAQLRADIVLVPHHGSAGSSSQEFVAATGARHAVFAAGHDNRFGHPRAEVVARWRDTGAQLWNTARHGALRFELGAAGIEATSWRQAEPRLWRAPVERD